MKIFTSYWQSSHMTIRVAPSLALALCVAACCTAAGAAVSGDQEADVTLEYVPGLCTAFEPGDLFEVQLVLNASSAVTALGAELTIPPDWTFDSLGGECPPDAQQIERTDDLLEFAWAITEGIEFPCTFSVFLQTPTTAEGEVDLSIKGLFRLEAPADQQETPQIFLRAGAGEVCKVAGCSGGARAAYSRGDALTVLLCIAALLLATRAHLRN
ncbi:MAG: hypothetical protein HYV27_22235 [Candidatus Hydrogenedentes bacterium]|nr:hypothetical protein [Candidatus Hydrogenedentota bacterium]